jgi:hypothetical protein
MATIGVREILGSQSPRTGLHGYQLFFWALDGHLFNGPLADQAVVIANYAQHLLPAQKRPEAWEFELVLDRDNQLQQISVVTKPNYPIDEAPLVNRVAHLDLIIVRHRLPAVLFGSQTLRSQLSRSDADSQCACMWRSHA